LSEKAAAGDFANYARVLDADPPTQAVFREVLRDEQFHMSYTHKELVRLSPRESDRLLWQARRRRLWRLYLRLTGGLASLVGGVILSAQYFVLVPPFALLAQRTARSEPQGWSQIPPARNGGDLHRQY
jgi:hypothetical protein